MTVVQAHPIQAHPIQAHPIQAHPIPTAELTRMRTTGQDVAGQPPQPWPAADGVPLRCCLRRARPGEDVVLISHAPRTEPSPWREVGPVFAHGEPCDGFDAASGLPPELRSGPRVLRPYRHDGTLNYDAIRVVGEGEDLEPTLREQLDREDVDEVHVRATAEQCFTYLVRRRVSAP